jgi:hypothetical protein
VNLNEFIVKYPNVDINDLMSTAFTVVNAIEEARQEINERDENDAIEEMQLKMQDEQALEWLRRKMDLQEYMPHESIFDESDDEPDYPFDYGDVGFDSNADEQYVTASTSYNANETFFFMSDEHGIHGGHELGCSMAERWGNVLWNVPSRIDRNIEDEFPNHDVKLSRSYRIEPDKEHPWAVEKRVYRVTKRQ